MPVVLRVRGWGLVLGEHCSSGGRTSSPREGLTVRLDRVVECAFGDDAEVGPLREVRRIVAVVVLPISRSFFAERCCALAVAVHESALTWLNLRMSVSSNGRVTDMSGEIRESSNFLDHLMPELELRSSLVT